MDKLRLIAEIIGLVTVIGGGGMAIIKTFHDLKDGIRCLLRADMMKVYYKHRDEDKLHEYEKQNFVFEYAAYKSLGGNSFIDDINAEIKGWEVIP